MPAGDAVLAEVLAAVEAGDAERVLEALEPASEGQRRRIAPKVRTRQEALRPDLFAAGRLAATPQRVAAATACIATAAARTIARLFDVNGDPGAVDPDLALRAVAPRGREFANELVERLLGLDRRATVFQARAWSVVRRLVRSGVADRPDGSEYIAIMISSVSRAPWRDADRIYDALREDPALLEDEVWRLFELDVVGELGEARTWEGRETPRENTWIRALARLAAEGHLDRTRLLDASLAALGRDFRASAIAWHGQLHEALAPTPDERVERIDGYASLLCTPSPAVVRYGLAALQEIESQVPVEVFVRGTPGPLALREKKYAVQALAMLDRALARHPASCAELLCAAAHGLGHVRPDVQERALGVLERHRLLVTDSVAVRSTILGFAESVAPTLRHRIDDLLGFAVDQPQTEPDPGPSPAARLALLDPETHEARTARKAVEEGASGCWPSPRTPPAPSPRVAAQPISSIDELIEIAALCLEGDAPAAELDRLLGALDATPDEDGRRRGAAVLERARKVLAAPRLPGFASARLAATALCAWLEHEGHPTVPTAPIANPPVSPPQPLTPRIEYYLDWRNIRLPGNPEASAALNALVRRPSVAGVALSNRRISDEDLRSAGVTDPDIARRAAGHPVLVFDAAPDDRDPAAQWLTQLYRDPRTRGFNREVLWAADRGGARWLISRYPARIEVFFAIAATNAYVFRDDNIVYGFVETVLERALDPLVELGKTGWMAVASALMVKTSETRRLAGDVVAATIGDGRFDPHALARALGWLLRNDAGNLRRATETLGDISRVSGVHAAQVLRLVEALLADIDPKTAGLHHPLELALQLSSDLDLWIASGDARAALSATLARTSRGSKAGRLAERLLERPENAASVRAWQEATAGVVVDWASGRL